MKHTPPKPAKKPFVMELHGRRRVDDYFWLNERENPEVRTYLAAENAYTDASLSPFDDLKSQLVDEMKSRIPEAEESAPYKDGDYFYYTRYEKGREYPLYCRKLLSLDADEQVLLDVNEVARGHDFCSVRNFSVTPDHTTAGFAVDYEGRRFYTLRFVDLGDGLLIDESIADVTGNFEWAADSVTLLYTRQEPETLRDYQVYRYNIANRKKSLVYQEDDDTNWLWVEKSLSGHFLFLVSAATLSTEVRYLRSDQPQSDPLLFQCRQPEHEYFVTDGADRFYILSNEAARDFKVMETPLDNTSSEYWQPVVEHRDGVLIESFDVFQDFVVLSIVEQGLTQFEVLQRSDGSLGRISFDEEVYSVCSDDNYEYATGKFRYSYESLTTPESIHDFDFKSLEHTLIKEQDIPGNFDRSNYQSERLMVTARDGAHVPVSLVYRKGFEKTGTNPMLVYAYGSYGMSMEADFDSDLFSLLDRGFAYAIAHVRGGSELGRQWYYDGRQLKKMNTFNDFIDVTRHLIASGYSSPAATYAQGGSAGGLLVGVVSNLAPGLYNGIAAEVPFVDIVTTMLDPDVPLTTGEWDEWGDPTNETFFEYMLSYSPYDNVETMEYPDMLVTAGLHDSQVQYWEPAKWVAKLRDYKTNDTEVLLKTNMKAGHSGKTGRYQSLEDTALVYTFFLMLEEQRNS